MSFRATYTTQFLYKHGQDKELAEIKSALEKYCRSVNWQGRDGGGYFHGTINGLYPEETKKDELEIVPELEKKGNFFRIRKKGNFFDYGLSVMG